MPFKRKRFRRKTTGSKLSKRQKKEVKKIVSGHIEHKEDTFAIFAAPIIYTGTLEPQDASGPIAGLSFTHIGQLLTEGGRIGDEIDLVSFECRFSVELNDTIVLTADPWAYVRVIFFRWKMDSFYEVPVLGTLLDLTAPAAAGIGGSNNVFALHSKPNAHKYHIIYDKMFNISNMIYYNGSSSTTGMDPGSRKLGHVKASGKKLGPRRIYFTNSEAAMPTNDGINHLYCMCVSNSVNTPHPQITLNTECVYMDA